MDVPETVAHRDARWIEAANRGDPEAFEALYRAYRDWVYRLAFRFTGKREDALDVLQETFAYLLRKLPSFELSSRMTTFLYPVVKHLSADARRKDSRFRSEAGALDSVLELAAKESLPESPEEGRAALAPVLLALPEAQREVLLLRYADELELDAIAAALSIPVGTVKSRLHHALQRLREDPHTRGYFES